MKQIINKSLENSFSYPGYMELLEKLVKKDDTTGETTSERINFTKLNFNRIKRINKTLEFSYEEKEFFKNISTPQKWLVILESWCADGAQTIPVLNKITETSDKIDLRIVLRDENPELMDEFLTNGSRSIPKLIILNENREVIAHWGPRSAEATKMVEAYKQEFGKIDTAFKIQLQIWYNKDRGKSIIKELIEITRDIEKGKAIPAL